MNILDLARRDIQGIYRNNDAFSLPITFTSLNDDVAQVMGQGMSHHISYGTDGQVVNGKNSHVTIVEGDLQDLGYPVRNAGGIVSLTGHRVSFSNERGIVGNYVVQQYFPDETLGLIVCVLSDTN